MNLPKAFRDCAEQASSKPAIFYGSTEVTYGRLWWQSCLLAAHLRQAFGVRPGDRVGLWLKNCPEFVASLFGILQAGAAVVPVNNFLKADEVAYILSDAEIDVMVTERSLAEAFLQLKEYRSGLRFWCVEDFAGLEASVEGAADAARAAHGPAPSESDLAVIIYTSGTTGRPKGAMLSHGNLLCNVASCQEVLRAVDADRFVVVLPMFHSFMLCVGVFLPLLVGGSIVLVRSLHPPKNVIEEIVARAGTVLPAIPQFFRTLANALLPEKLPLRICVSGGAPLPQEILREWRSKVPVPLLEGYGLSEASPVVSLNPIAGPWKDGSIGVPIPGVDVSVQNSAGEMLSPRQTGEICVRGGNVMLGYWKRPDETALAIRNGWLLTGDIGHVDEEGYFYVTDRKKDMLLVNGMNVYPREIEEILYQHPGVKEVAVVGIPDARKGEQAVAFVALKDGAQLDERVLTSFVRGRIADYKVPKRVLFLSSLPRNATGKVLKTVLREELPRL